MILKISMTRQVQWSKISNMSLAILDYFSAFTQQPVHGVYHVWLIAWNWVGRKDDYIARLNLDVLMCTRNHTIQDSIQLALRTSTDHRYLIIWQLNDVFHLHDSIFWNFNHICAQSYLDVINHRKTSKSYLTTTLGGLIQNQFNTLNLRGETAHNHPTISVMIHNSTEILADIIF